MIRLMHATALAFAISGTLLVTSAEAASPASITITGPTSGFADVCSAPSVNNPNVQVIANEPAGYSDTFAITAPGFGGYTWKGENGPYPSSTYGLGYPTLWGINVPANTPITATIYVYSGADLTGTRIYSSAITWNCTTGVVAGIVNTDLTQASIENSVPTLSTEWVLVLAALVAGVGIVLLPRRER